MVRDVDKEVYKPRNCVERLLVLLAQDESTMQAHDGEMFSWVLEGEQPLKHKGPSQKCSHLLNIWVAERSQCHYGIW